MKGSVQIILCSLMMMFSIGLQAGNPDRQGESGASELLLNPWARSAGLHSMTAAMIEGVEAMRVNVAGLCRVKRTQILLGYTRYLEGTEMGISAAGIATPMSKNGVLGISIMAMDFGDIEVTTTNLPQGTGATYSPTFFNLGVSYAHIFENKVSVGFTVRLVSESTANLNAQGLAIDAGVQYVTGANDNFKLGISLRNIGTPMSFGGEGLSRRLANPNKEITYELSYDQRASRFELPSLLHIGLAYDVYKTEKQKVTLIGNFTANSFARDEIGGGIEYTVFNLISLRAGYKKSLGSNFDQIRDQVYTGLSGGVSLDIPFGDTDQSFGLDYAYRATDPWGGTHNLSVRLDL